MTARRGCRAAAICGDGIIEGAEECDDGNTNDGDGCSGICDIEWGVLNYTPDQEAIDQEF